MTQLDVAGWTRGPFGHPFAGWSYPRGRLSGPLMLRGGPQPYPLGELMWTMLTDNLWQGHPHRVTSIVRSGA